MIPYSQYNVSDIHCTAYSAHLFPEVLEVPAGDDGDVDVGHVGEALEALLALGADEGQLGRLGQPGQGTVKVQDHPQLGAHLEQGRQRFVHIDDHCDYFSIKWL